MNDLGLLALVTFALFMLCGIAAARLEYAATDKPGWRTVYRVLIVVLFGVCVVYGYVELWER